MHAALPWRIEETCWNAFPALRQVLFHGWLMRFSDGLSRRANSANPLGPAAPDIAATIAVAEALYRAQGLPAIFRIPSIVDGAVDAALAARFYAGEGESCVLHGAIDAIAAGPDPAVHLLPSPAPRWSAAMARLQSHSAAQHVTYRRIVDALVVPARFALLAVDGAPVALAYGALHDGLLCYESVVTDPRERRRGNARRVIASLAAWARDNGAAGACLQVESANAPARALYASLGFAELYRYHYRRQPPPR